MGVSVIYVLPHFLHMLDKIFAMGKVDIFCPANSDRLYFFVPHHGAAAKPAGAGPALLDGSRKALVFARDADSGNLGVRLI